MKKIIILMLLATAATACGQNPEASVREKVFKQECHKKGGKLMDLRVKRKGWADTYCVLSIGQYGDHL